MTNLNNKFKDRNPENTISCIKDFFENKGFELKIEHQKSFENVYSCLIYLCYDGEKINRTFGKGTTKEFAEASGLSEMMERIILNCFDYSSFITKYRIKENAPFYFSKDEKIFTFDEIKNKKFKMLETHIKRTPENIYKEKLSKHADFIENNEKKYICLPFKNISTNEIEYIPYKFYRKNTGSTGLAFGNTFEEAMVRAISEIIERNTNIEIAIKNTNLPIIPNKDIKNLNINLYNTIKEIEKDGYKVVIKETSRGKNYPSISVVVYNANNLGYTVKTGTFPVFDIALERCITEIYQMRKKQEVLILTSMQRLERKKEKDFSKEEIFNSVMSCTIHNDSFLLSNNKKYSISHFSNASSNEEFLNYYKDLLNKNGHEIFFRSTNINGLYAVNVCVTNMEVGPFLNMNDLPDGYGIDDIEDIRKFESLEDRISLYKEIRVGRLKTLYETMINEIVENGYNQKVENYCNDIKGELDIFYYREYYKKCSKNFQKMFFDLYHLVSLLKTLISFYKKKEENSLLIENPFINDNEKNIIKILIEKNEEKIKNLFLNEDLLINKKLENAIINSLKDLIF